MFRDKIGDYFEGVAAKYLSAVDADPGKSNQHEIGGLPSAGFTRWLGTPSFGERPRFRSRQVYISDQDEEPTVCDGQVSWYNTRENQSGRSPEYRLYYASTPVTDLLKDGDFFLVAKHKDGSLLMAFCPRGSTVEQQLRLVFGVEDVGEKFKAGTLNASSLLLPLRLMLESLGIDLNRPSTDDGVWLSRLIDAFGGSAFPATSEFSEFSRKTMEVDVAPVQRPDEALVALMEHEEKLFRIFERHLVKDRLGRGFGEHGEDVDEFISFSLSVQNRRKSRVGHAFERHLSYLFRKNDLKFEQGGTKLVTENNARPDFLFPSFTAYHDPGYSTSKLVVLGAKTTCKDRWRQVLSEAQRVSTKHLITLEAAISETQTNEMTAHHLTLVLPASIHSTYNAHQRSNLLDLNTFISMTKKLQI